MNIVTSADTNFFHCLYELTKSVRKFYNKPAIVYDVGLTEEDRDQLDAIIVPIKVEVDFQGYAEVARGAMAIKATHKPFCVKHYFENYSEPMIFIDADCLMNARVEEAGFDVGVTLRTSPRKVDLSEPYEGILNSGVVFFNTNAGEFIDRWIEECMKDNTTDQKALVDTLSETIDWKHWNKVYDWHGIKVKVFDTTYNETHLRKRGKILHFKAAKHKKVIYEQLMDAYRAGKDLRKVVKKMRRKQKELWIS